MSSDVHLVDPCPQIPAVFVDPLQSLKLAQQIGHATVPAGIRFRNLKRKAKKRPSRKTPRGRGVPKLSAVG